MTEPTVSRRGVYYDLTKSPYEYESPYGDVFKFSSKKKLEMYARDINKEVLRLDKAIKRNDLHKWIPLEIHQMLERLVYKSFYKKIEG